MRPIAEGLLGFAAREFGGAAEVGGAFDEAHAFAAATGSGLHQHRVADRDGGLLERGEILRCAVRARHDWNARLLHDAARADLGTHGFDGGRWRADEDQAGIGAAAREAGILGQESVARVHGVAAGARRDLDQFVLVQVGLRGLGGTQEIGLVGARHMRCARIGLRVHRHCTDTQLAQRALDADRDLATIRDQHLAEHLSGRGERGGCWCRCNMRLGLAGFGAHS